MSILNPRQDVLIANDTSARHALSVEYEMEDAERRQGGVLLRLRPKQDPRRKTYRKSLRFWITEDALARAGLVHVTEAERALLREMLQNAEVRDVLDKRRADETEKAYLSRIDSGATAIRTLRDRFRQSPKGKERS